MQTPSHPPPETREAAPSLNKAATQYANQLQGNATLSTQTGKPSLASAKISYYTTAKDVSPSREITIREFCRMVHDGETAAAVAKVRSAATEDEKRAAKMRLPAVQLSGHVTEGKRAKAMEEGRFVHSGFLQLDVDGDGLNGMTPEDARAMMATDPHVLSAFISPSGKGAKAIFRVLPCETVDEHKATFAAVEKHISETYGLAIDPATKDPGRLCYLPSDPECTWNGNPVEFLIPEPPEITLPTASKNTAPPVIRSKAFPEPPENGIHSWLMEAAWHCRLVDRMTEQETVAKLESYNGSLRRSLQPAEARDAARTVFSTQLENKRPEGIDPTPASETPSPFPTHCIPGVAADMAREIARVSTAQNEPLAAATVLSVISAAMGAGIEVGTGGGRSVRGNTFTLAIAESGTGKGETYSIAAEPFEQLEAEALEAFDMHTRPGLVASLNVATTRAAKLCKDAAKESDPNARRGTLMEYQSAEAERVAIQREIDAAPRWRVADTTREALAAILQGQPGEACASMSSEARGILSIIKGKYTKEGGDEDFYCSGYSGDSIKITRKTGGNVSLRRPCLTVLWMMQPDAARKAFGDEVLAESGFLARFLTFDPKAEPQERYEQPAPIPNRITAGWRDLIASLVIRYRANGNVPATITATSAASAIMTDYERENIRRRRKTGDLRDLAPFVARWTENAWRLALVIHCAAHGMKADAVMLDAEAAGAGVELMRWFSEMQLEVLRTGRREKLTKRVLAVLAVLAEAKGEISIRELRRSHSFEVEELRQLESLFPKAFRLVERRGEVGRPSLVATTRLEDKEK